MPTLKRLGEWLKLSVNRYELTLECGVEVVVYREADEPVWQFVVRGFGLLDDRVYNTGKLDGEEAKGAALRSIAARLGRANSQITAVLVSTEPRPTEGEPIGNHDG